MLGNQSKAPDKKKPGQKPPGQKPADNKPPWIIAKYAVDANLFRLGSTNPKKIQPLVFLLAFISGAFVRVAFDLKPLHHIHQVTCF